MWTWFLSLFGPGKPTAARLVRKLKSPHPEVRLEAVQPLATIAEPWAIGVLLPLLEHADAQLREAARADLTARGPAVVPVVSARVERSDPATAKLLIDLLAE